MKKFLFPIPFLAVLLFPSDTFATRVDVDVNHLDDYFTSTWPITATISSDSFIITNSNNSRYRAGFKINSNVNNTLNCPLLNGSNNIYSRVVYGSGWESSMFSGFGQNVVSGQYNDGIVYHLAISGTPIAYFYENSDTSYLIPINVNYKFESITLGCSAEEVAPASPTPTPTPTPTATPTPTPTEEPSPTPTPEEIDPSEYEYNAVEDSIIKYRFISWIIISVAGFLIYKLIIKRIIIR